MDPAQYYITTLTTAFTKLAPIFIFLVGGYFVFIKLPFLFLKKSMDDQKKVLENEKKEETPKIERIQVKSKVENKEGTKKQEQKKQAPSQKPRPTQSQTPEEVFGFKAGEAIGQSELKKRYFELLKQNHPDRVATMGPDFKKLAEKNTKDLNDAYEKLKKKAA